ncbi:hypothetical protein Y032_0020g68 [Ancylostoma ceylanicum]|uniref:Uncharacterized protein n=1 Tax=Ancylostoma ceylanicum TaxID=53326 RepID=A0A016V1A2_9BILA|nr:hypothetical protein Y032_0020g68 [Ancylostoma ceylanicum]
MLSRGSRLCATGTISASISDDIEYNINMLMQMRERVDAKLLEIKQRKKDHKAQLRELKTEMLEMHRELGEWDRKYDELTDAIKRMEITRSQLQERIKEQRQKETAAKLVCVEIDRKLHQLFGSTTSPGHACEEYCHAHGLKSQFSTVTTSGSHEGTTLVEDVLLPPNK